MGFVMASEEMMARSGKRSVSLDVEFVFAAWLTRPEVVRALLPPPLEPLEIPLAWSMLANFRETNFSPAYQEAGLSLGAQHRGARGTYCLSMPVNDGQVLVAGREIYGMPKKLGQVVFQANGNRVKGWCERHSHRILQVKLDLDQPPQDARMHEINPWKEPHGNALGRSLTLFNFKAFSAPDWSGFDYPPRLVRFSLRAEHRKVKFCRAEIELNDSPFDPWTEVEIVETLGAVYTRGQTCMGAGQVVAEVEPSRFSPYYLSRFDVYE